MTARVATKDIEAPESGESQNRARLEALTRTAAKRQWSLETAVDWSAPVVRPWWLSRKTYAAIVSQLYHAEVATAQMCRRLRAELPESLARRFLETQYADELRHARAYRAYLQRLGDIAPMNDTLAAALDRALDSSGPYYRAMVAFNVVLEGEAVRLQNEMSKLFPCPLFRRINAHISRDEARHVAFGKLYLRDKLSGLPAEERLDIYDWIMALWRECVFANGGLGKTPFSGPIRLSGRCLDRRWVKHHKALIDIGLITSHDRSRLEPIKDVPR